MLRSIVFLLVITSLITTPTKAYEANANLIVQKQQLIKNEQELKTNIHTKKNIDFSLSRLSAQYRRSRAVQDMVCAFNNQSQMTPQALLRRRTMRDVRAQDVCYQAVIKAEKKYQVKEGLLQTIASVESGRWDSKVQQRVSWPWAVQVNGKGYYYSSKEEAVAAVKELMAEGVTNIDVGCMQINLKYHGAAFRNIEEAFDPEKNVSYSAQFLRKLYLSNGHNWSKTAMQYHSKNVARGLIYRDKLEQHYSVYVATDGYQTLF